MKPSKKDSFVSIDTFYTNGTDYEFGYDDQGIVLIAREKLFSYYIDSPASFTRYRNKAAVFRYRSLMADEAVADYKRQRAKRECPVSGE